MDILNAISATAFATWVRESGSLFGYPMFILLHTLGLATLVGLSSIAALSMLGSPPPREREHLRPLFAWIWAGFALNTASGVVLFAADAPSMFLNRVMWVKFAFIIAAVLVIRRLQTRVFTPEAVAGGRTTDHGGWLAAGILACWAGAIVTGRLTAYIGPIVGLE